MMSHMENLDWRNPLAKEFLDFVKTRQQRAFPQQRTGFVEESPLPVPPPPVVETPKETSEAPVPVKCKHSLKTFETPHGNFSCDLCSQKQAARTVMHGCRECNFDVCEGCQAIHRLSLQTPPVLVPPTLVAQQAKFVADVTLADGCVVRPGEQLHKTWRIRNPGMERWLRGTRIAHVGGDAFGGPMNGMEVPLAGPGEAVNVTVALVMPQHPGRYTSYWRMMTPHPANSKFGDRFWVTVNVVPNVAPIVAQAQTPGVIIRPPPPRPAIVSPPGFVAGSPLLASIAVRPPPPPPIRPVADEEPIVKPEYEIAVAQITEFGFSDIDKIVKILNEVNGDTGAAIDRLLEDQ